MLSQFAAGCDPGIRRTATGEKPAPLQRGEAFRDMAAQSGLEFRWGHGGRSPLTILETAGGGAGFLDYDADGSLDIVLVGSRIALYHNEGISGGRTRFRNATPGSGLRATGELMGCAVGDYDGDGRVDLLVTGHRVRRLYRNLDGRGRFEDTTIRARLAPRDPFRWDTSAGFADLDADGSLDLVICGYVRYTPRSRVACEFPAAGGGRILAACPPFYYPPQRIQVFRNRGGVFEDVTQDMPPGHGASLGLGFADYDDDGRLDFYVANDGEPGDPYRNVGVSAGRWQFVNEGITSGTAYNQDGKEQAGMGVEWADYNNDLRLDLFVTTFQNEVKSLYRNHGNGMFSYASFTAGIADATLKRLAFGVALFDHDNDGHRDILLANGHVQDSIERIHPPATYRQTLQLLRNRGDGTFVDASEQGGGAFRKSIVGRALARGDYDNDGRVDALVADLEGAPLLLHNKGLGENRWIGILPMTRLGSPAIGARVRLPDRPESGADEVHTCRSYLTAADPRVHFGLGTENRPVNVEIRWPSGRKTTHREVPIGRYNSIREPAAQP